MPFVADLPVDWAPWLGDMGVPVGTPFLLSPALGYDVALNAFFRCPSMLGTAWNTQAGYARDLRAFLDFLWTARGGTLWRDATEADHAAYLVWRRFDVNGPRVDPRTWDREAAAVNRFYRWQVRAGNVPASPIPQRESRPMPSGAGRGWPAGDPRAAGETPATYSHGAGRDKIEWLPASSYRRWRDVGMRGHTAAGLPDPRFRGRWAGRNATFCDLMVRTGLRLSEQAALNVFEVPLQRSGAGYRRFWLPPAIAKGGSARWVYVPASTATELAVYAEIDRAAVVEQARAEGRYRRVRRPLVVEDPDRPVVLDTHAGGGRRIKASQLDLAERRRLFVDGPQGLQPAAFWLSEYGLPVAVSTWKGLFGEANARCRAHGVDLHAHAHLLRHTFAVITLEQLQRGHILVAAQRITWLVESGRAEEACALCEREFPPPDFPATPGWLAGLLARAGRGAEATALLDRLAAERFASLPRDSEWVAALCLAADGAALVGHASAAEVLRELLTPYADRWAVDGIGAACLGPVSGYLKRLAGVAPAASPGPGPGSGRFRHDGELWTLEYDGATVRLRSAKGLHDLARLLAEPAREFHVLDLVSATGRGGAPADAHLHESGHAGEVLDEAARSAYRRRLAELDTEVDEFADTDPGRAERARAERDALVDALAAAYGLGGRPRHLDDPVDRARSTVTQRIRAALRRIEQQHPALGAHLRNSIRTGTYCSYRPERPVTWLR